MQAQKGSGGYGDPYFAELIEEAYEQEHPSEYKSQNLKGQSIQISAHNSAELFPDQGIKATLSLGIRTFILGLRI